MPQGVTYRSGIAYVHLVTVVVITAAVGVILSATGAAIVGTIGLTWVLLVLRSGIEVTDRGFKVRGHLRTHNLDWSETDAFIVVGYSGDTAYFGNVTGGTPYSTGLRRVSAPAALTEATLANREHISASWPSSPATADGSRCPEPRPHSYRPASRHVLRRN